VGVGTDAPKVTDTAPLSYQEAAEWIFNTEEKHDLLQYTIDGWCAWPLLRGMVQSALQQIPGGAVSRESTIQRISSSARDLVRLTLAKRSRYLIKSYSTGLRELSNDGYVDIYFDALLARLTSFLKIEFVNNSYFHQRNKNARFPSYCTNYGIDLVGGLIARLRPQSNIRQIAEQLSSCLKREPRLKAFSSERVLGTLMYFTSRRSVWIAVLKRIQPRIVLVADTNEAPITAAARELGISVVEIQHGLITRDHCYYAYTNYALPYKERMALPHRLFMYGDHWCREVASHGFWNQELKPVGAPHVDRYRSERNGYNRDPNVIKLLVTTQGQSREELIAYLQEFLVQAKCRIKCEVSIKLHPVFDTDKGPYERAFTTQPVRIIGGTDAPSTFELLIQSDAHATISSACHYDAIGLDVPTAVLPLAGHETVKQLYEKGHAHLVREPSDLVSWLEHDIIATNAAGLSESFFTSNATENMLRELSKLDTESTAI